MPQTTAKDPSTLSHAHELFCIALHAGMTKADAYREAYPKSRLWKAASASNKASNLANKPHIQARLAAMREPVMRAIQANSAGYGLLQAMDEAQRAMALAESSGQAGAMVAAIQLRAKLNGLITDKKEVTVTEMGGMTPSEKAALLEAARGQLSMLKLPEQAIDDVEPKGPSDIV